MKLRAVLFDFDGVIADTENVHVTAWERTFNDLGWDVSSEVCQRAAEEDDRLFLAEIFSQHGVANGDVTGWIRRKQDLTVALLNDWPPVYPGFANLVHELVGRVRLAVVSGTWRENVHAVLRAAGVADAFELVVGKEDVTAPKPDPEPYRVALKALKLSPSATVALEDSPTGLASARAAGVPCLAIGHRRPQGDWIESAPYLPDLDAVRTHFASA